jgi:hypothetical protein
MATSDPLKFNPNIIFPSGRLTNSNEDKLLEKTLFLKFCCRKFVDTVTSSALNIKATDLYSGMDQKISTIFVPAPKQIISNTTLKYTDDTTTATSLKSLGIGALEFITEFGGLGKLFASQTEGRRDIDNTQSLFSNSEKRSFSLSFTLLATSTVEAREIALIANTFHALALPTFKTLGGSPGGAAAGAGSGAAAGASVGALFGGVGAIPGALIGASVASVSSLIPIDKGFSPPLWRFGIGTGITGKIDPSWLGQTQICVLKSVSINTAAGGSPYMIEDKGNMPKPLLVSFALNFTELDPVYRLEDGINIISKNAV